MPDVGVCGYVSLSKDFFFLPSGFIRHTVKILVLGTNSGRKATASIRNTNRILHNYCLKSNLM